MWLLLDDELQGSDAVKTLLPLLILSERVVLEQAFQPSLNDDTDQSDKLRIRLISAWMLQELFD